MTKRFNRLFESVKHDLDKKTWDTYLSSNEELRVAVDLMRKIKTQFPDGEIYIVGGVPRDILMGNDVDDVDLATNISFEELSEFYELRNISKSESQPVYKINYNGQSLDLAQFREDSKGGVGRNSNISTIINSFEKDSERRDLTINSFGLNERGEIVDYQNGIEDLNNKIIRTVGDAKERFLEDATRILRVARFAAKMGFSIEAETRRSMIEMKHLLSNSELISNESISKEFYKAAKSGPSLRRFIEHLIDTNIINDVLPELMPMSGMWHDTKHHPEAKGNVLGHILECLSASPFKDPVINLAILFHDFGKATTQAYKSGSNGPSTFYGHEAAGVPIVSNIFDRLKFNELTSSDKRGILFAVEKHMLVHNLLSLNIKTLTKLINDPNWNILKSVSYADEASRGPSLFNKEEFLTKIKLAEEKVRALGDSETLRLKIKEIIDGTKLMEWFPKLKEDPKLIRPVLSKLQDFVLEQLNAGKVIDPNELWKMANEIINKNK